MTGDALAPTAPALRFVIGPDRGLVADLAGKLPGRGMWVSADRAALNKAAKKGLFSRSAKAPVTVSDGLLAAAKTHDASLIVMGAYGHMRIGELLFGGTTSKLLHSEAAPALALSH